MTVPLILAVIAALGVYLLYTSVAWQRRALRAPRVNRQSLELVSRFNDRLVQAGIHKEDQAQVVATVGGLLVIGTVLGWMIFGGVLGPLVLGLFASSFPVASYRTKRNRTRAEAAEAWPRMIEEIRLLCGSLGRPIPQALLEVGRAAPPEMRPAFSEAEREWRISTDFERTVAILKLRLADPTADATCETLLVAHRLGGADIDRRLAALADDRNADLQGRKDARAKQAGVVFARRFVLVVPAGMAIAGMSIGNGRDAYQTANGQIGVALAVLTLAACWWWAGRLIALPQEERVFRA